MLDGLPVCGSVMEASVADINRASQRAKRARWRQTGTTLPAVFANGMFIGQHGSWNRRPHSGYKVIFVPFESGRPSGAPVDVLTGFLSEEDEAYGRPAGVAARPAGRVARGRRRGQWGLARDRSALNPDRCHCQTPLCRASRDPDVIVA